MLLAADKVLQSKKTLTEGDNRLDVELLEQSCRLIGTCTARFSPLLTGTEFFKGRISASLNSAEFSQEEFQHCWWVLNISEVGNLCPD